MGLLDQLLNQATGAQQNAGGLGGLLSMVTANPQIVSALAGLLSTQNTSIGGPAGLGGILSSFQQNGLGNLVSSWVSTGQNAPVSPEQVSQALGPDTVGQFANQAGVPVSDAGSLLAQLLPAAVDHLTPNGQVPDTDSLEQSLSAIVSRFQR
jgi:uncharacterized protein YidB (DUF937 family)